MTLAGSKQRALLALLVLHANETLSTGRLIDELWGEFPPATATKSSCRRTSRVCVRRLSDRQTTALLAGADARGRLRADADRESVDACRFESLVIDGRSELVAQRPESAALALEAALSMWRGRPLVEFAGQHFAQAEIARLEELRLAALEELTEAISPLDATLSLLASSRR